MHEYICLRIQISLEQLIKYGKSRRLIKTILNKKNTI